jgi:ketosteroid isomerase-like protein
VRLAGDVTAQRAAAAARLVAAAPPAAALAELDLSRASHLEAAAAERIAAALAAPSVGIAQLLLRVRPGPVARLLEAAGLAEEDGGPATIVATSDAIRPPDSATEVVMQFYEALASRDWSGLRHLVGEEPSWSVPTVAGSPPRADPEHIADFHARSIQAVPGVTPAVTTTESDGRTVVVRGSHVVPAREDAAARFRHRWHVAGDKVVAFREQVDATAYSQLQAHRHR